MKLMNQLKLLKKIRKMQKIREIMSNVLNNDNYLLKNQKKNNS